LGVEPASEHNPGAFRDNQLSPPSGMSTREGLGYSHPASIACLREEEVTLQILHPRCCGLDVHKSSITGCCLWFDAEGRRQEEIRKFGTHTFELRQLAEWLRQHEVKNVVMEATGSYWRPVWNVLEANGFQQMLANPQHIKAVPGRKTDTKDAQWIADLFQHGLIAPSFVPDQQMRHLRDLTRMRTKLTQDRTRVVNRIEAVLEDANIKLSSVATDIMGVSAQAMVQSLLNGERDTTRLAALAQGRMRAKRLQLQTALEGNLQPHHVFVLRRLLMQSRFLEQQRHALSQQIERCLNKEMREAIALWDSIPGVDEDIATVMVAEMGIHPEQFPDGPHAASWIAICPGNHESAGKRKSGKTRQGNRWLRGVLTQAAWAASRTKGTYLSAFFRRIAARRGAKRATIAVAHSIVISAYYMWKNKQPYQELGDTFLDQLKPEKTANRLLKRLVKLGYIVTITEVPNPAA
jgi:transposase